MATYQVKQDCSWGRRGDLVEVKDKLTDRQEQLLVAYNPKVAKADNSDEPSAKKVATGKAGDTKSDHTKKD